METLADEIKKVYQESEGEVSDKLEYATITIKMPRVGSPSISVDKPHLVTAAKIEALEIAIYREVLKQRAAALNAARRNSEGDLDD